MKMTLNEALNCPRDMSFDDYAKLIDKRMRQESKLRKLFDQKYDLEDALYTVLNDEVGSDRWNRKAKELAEVDSKIDEVKIKIDEIDKKIGVVK